MDRLAFLSPTEVAALSRHEREERVRLLVQQSHNILTRAIERHANADGRTLVGTVVLFSGGNDSTVLAHLMRDRASHAAHANTTVGLEATREFVRQTCRAWDLPLLEFAPPRECDHYENLVLDHGFPGPGHHFKMYQRLKERSLEQVRRQFVQNPYRERVVFLAGRRRTESARRASIPAVERRGSTVWVSPLVNWTRFDLTTYRLLNADVPVNEVTDLIHMSGECLCGSFAKPGEREELAFWFPAFEAQIQELESRIAEVPGIPDHRRRWGWGATLREPERRRGASGPLCSSCDARFASGGAG
ncbi:phosphoadenosine phosphosulfate reductase family protein [uncultured Nocardioides sp.]|uniref:phosphoadenosine phosphosulfate reductase domain-containing protein n=1 Tax=uncultured Nocardioides sp. TaxID=198441 RepID=UPI002617757F|nr:phosphoadenosine phosphosulfate reductase family protein [uncultured Nocardioides sp.]